MRPAGASGLRVVVLCEQAITRASMTALLESSPGVARVDPAGDATAAAALCDESGAAVVLVFHGAPARTVAGVRRLREAGCAVPVLALGLERSTAFARGVLGAGARGILTTDVAPDDLVGALRAVAGGARYVHPSLGAMLADAEDVREIDELSQRERDVLRLITLGYTNPEIAERLVVSVRTVETHRAHLARKIGADSRADLVRYALERGVLSAE